MTCKRGSYNFLSRLLVNNTTKQHNCLGTTINPQKKTASATLIDSGTEDQPYLAVREPKPLKDMPGPRPSIPFIGTAWQYFPGGRYNLSNMHESYIDKYFRYGSIVKEEFQWRKPVVHVFDTHDLDVVNRAQGPQPNRPLSEFVIHYRKNRPEKYDSVGLANTLGSEWAQLRLKLNPVMSTYTHFDYMMGALNSICDDFVKLVKNERDPETFCINDLQDQVYRLSLESIYMMSLETRLGCLEANLHPTSPASSMIYSVKLLFEAFHELTYGLPLWKFFPTAAYKKLDKAESIMYAAASNRVEEVMADIKKNGMPDGRLPGILHTLLHSKDLTDKETKVTIIDFISGGIFTITNAFSFLLYHIAKYPDVQAKLYEEVKRIMPDGVATSERVLRMEYLKGCVKESFRLTPTIPNITRILPVDVVLSGYHVPAGTQLFCNYTVACMHPEKYPEPEKFKPERWATIKRPVYFWNFGVGARMCIGKRFAELEMHSALAKLIYNFKLESTGQEVKCKQAFIVVPSHPVSIIFKDRKNC